MSSPSNPVGWFEIYVDDMPRAKAFYEAVIGIELSVLPNPGKTEIPLEMYAFPGDMEKYGATGALVKMDGVTAGGGNTLVYFSCEDCAENEDRIESAGGRLQQAKTPIGEHGFISLAIDTEGNMFGLHSMN